jgi:Bcr/CflA subfamily drug resistance transporter
MSAIQLNKTHLLWMLLLSVTFAHLGVDIYVPSLPAMAKELHSPDIANTLTTYLLGMGFSQFLFGPYSDRFGRRRMLLWGLMIFLVATVICIFATSATWLYVGRLFQGLGIGAANVLGRAIVRDVFAARELTRIMSYITCTWALTPLIAPVIGSYIQTWLGWRYAFVFLFVYVGFSTVLFYRWLPETLQKKDLEAIKWKVMLRNYWQLFSYRSYVGNVLCIVIVMGPILAFPAFAPFLLQDHWQVSTVDYGWLTLLVSLGYVFSTFTCGKLLYVVKEGQLIKMSLLLYFTATFLMVMLSFFGAMHLVRFIMFMFLVFFSVGFIFPICISNALLPFSEQTGTASGLIGSVSMLGGAVVTMIVSYLPKRSSTSLSIFLWIDAILLTIVFFKLVSRQALE